MRTALRGAVWTVLAAGLYVLSGAAFLPRVGAARWMDPGETALMALRREAGTELRPREWMELRGLPAAVPEAVLAGEDDLFASHGGFHVPGLRLAARGNVREGRLARGGSTITQQLAKNLWLSPARNPLRKLKEAGLTLALEVALPKPRILELYLNVIEWGPGVFGIGAAAREHFGKPARQLSRREAALLAAAVPQPLRFDPRHPSNQLRRQQAVLLQRMSRWDLAPDEWTPRAGPLRRDAGPPRRRTPFADTS